MKDNFSMIRKRVMRIVKRASRIMHASYTIEEKDSPSNIVTSADIGVQKFLEKRLCKLLQKSQLLGEEGDKHQSDSEYLWIVDPIDGTTNFARGIGECAISVALLHNEEIVLGVVYNPYQKKMFYAERGKGAWCNGKKIHVSNAGFKQGIFCTAYSLYKKEFADKCERVLAEVYEQCNDFRRFGSCALELCYLAEGKCDLYFEFRVFPWDYAAAHLILEEAGGVIYGQKNQELHFDRTTPIIAANTVENYEKLRSIIEKHIDEYAYEEVFRCAKEGKALKKKISYQKA